MPPSTRPSSSQSSIHQHLKLHAPQHPAVKLAKQHPPAPQTACPLAPGPQSRNFQITFPSLFEVRTPIAFSYLGKIEYVELVFTRPHDSVGPSCWLMCKFHCQPCGHRFPSIMDCRRWQERGFGRHIEGQETAPKAHGYVAFRRRNREP